MRIWVEIKHNGVMGLGYITVWLESFCYWFEVRLILRMWGVLGWILEVNWELEGLEIIKILAQGFEGKIFQWIPASLIQNFENLCSWKCDLENVTLYSYWVWLMFSASREVNIGIGEKFEVFGCLCQGLAPRNGVPRKSYFEGFLGDSMNLEVLRGYQEFFRTLVVYSRSPEILEGFPKFLESRVCF